jgi:hypothetical protein
VSQVATDLIAVSTIAELELFDIMNATKTRSLKIDTPVQFLVRVNPFEMEFEMRSKFLQEACIGYNSGSLISVGVFDKVHQAANTDSEMSDLSQPEETKEEIKDLQQHLDVTNFGMFGDLMEKAAQKGLLKRKLIQKNYKAVSFTQVEGLTAQVTKNGEKTNQNMLYLCPTQDQKTILRFRLALK